MRFWWVGEVLFFQFSKMRRRARSITKLSTLICELLRLISVGTTPSRDIIGSVGNLFLDIFDKVLIIVDQYRLILGQFQNVCDSEAGA